MTLSIVQPFLQWVQKTPQRTALVTNDDRWSYEEIYVKASVIAAALKNEDSATITRVAILGNKSNNSVTAILGTLFAGFSYCPLDTNLPAGRIDKIFSILSPIGLILTGLTPSLRYELNNLKVKPYFVLDLVGDLPQDILKEVKRINLIKNNHFFEPKPKNPAYIIFTSGSTGTPKGVAMSHNAANAALTMFQEHIGIQENDKIYNQVALCFDLSVFDIFGALRQGASIYIAPASINVVPSRSIQYVIEKSITSLFTVPSTVNYLIDNTGITLKESSLKRILLSGELISSALLKKIKKFFPDHTEVWNLYGATEIPYVLAEKITEKTSLNYFSLKGNGVLIRIDNEEELAIKSPAMLSGYYVEGNTSLVTPFKENGWYSTGDIASIEANGNVIIHGRKDRQIKIQGHRIELDEIEHELEKYPGVQEAIVLFPTKERQLIAFIAVNPDFEGGLDQTIMNENCKTSLPLIMCPQKYYFLSKLPHTPSGKKDRKALLNVINLDCRDIKKDYIW